MKRIYKRRIFISVVLVTLAMMSGFAAWSMPRYAYVEQDGYGFNISVQQDGEVSVGMSGDPDVILCKIDDSLIEAAVAGGGEIRLPDEMTYNGNQYKIKKIMGLFQDTDGIKTVVLPKYLGTMISSMNNCADLSSIVFNEGFGSVMFSINQLPSLTDLNISGLNFGVLEGSLTGLPINEIDLSGFYGVQKCSCGGWPNVTRLEFPLEFGTAEMSTFVAMPKLEEIVLPATVECLSPNMFSECTNVRRIYARSMTPPPLGEWGSPGGYLNDYGEGFFSDEPTQIDKSTCVLYVPEGAAAVYRENEYWGRFKNIVEYNYGGVDEVAVEGSVIDRLRVSEGSIFVPGSGEAVTVSDLNGRCVYQDRQAVGSDVAVSPGIYVVRIGGDVRKVAVR